MQLKWYKKSDESVWPVGSSRLSTRDAKYQGQGKDVLDAVDVVHLQEALATRHGLWRFNSLFAVYSGDSWSCWQ